MLRLYRIDYTFWNSKFLQLYQCQYQRSSVHWGNGFLIEQHKSNTNTLNVISLCKLHVWIYGLSTFIRKKSLLNYMHICITELTLSGSLQYQSFLIQFFSLTRTLAHSQTQEISMFLGWFTYLLTEANYSVHSHWSEWKIFKCTTVFMLPDGKRLIMALQTLKWWFLKNSNDALKMRLLGDGGYSLMNSCFQRKQGSVSKWDMFGSLYFLLHSRAIGSTWKISAHTSSI